jgi:uncharacterized protein
LMIDLRAQGGSEGERVTMGYKEVRDVRGALLWLNERGFASGEVVLHGFSLGGATVLRAAPKSGVAAVVEESAYSDLPLILRQQLPKASGLPSFFTPGIFVMGKLFLGIDPWAVQPEEDAQRLCEKRIPLLIIHSTDDETTPFEHARRIKAACPEATLWKIDGYEHVGAYAHPEYRQRILGFLRSEVFPEEISAYPPAVGLVIVRKRFASGVAQRQAVAKKGYGPGNRWISPAAPNDTDF